MRRHVLDYTFWCVSPFVLMAIAAYMVRGRLQRDVPSFFNFVLFGIASFAVEFPLRNWDNSFYVYWVITTLSAFFSFAVVVEIVEDIVRRTKALPHTNLALLCWCTVAVLALVAIWPPHYSMDNVTNGIYMVDRTVRFTQFALAFFLVMFGAAVGISRRNLIFGIAGGFGLFALVNLGVTTLLSHGTPLSKATLSRVNGAAYVICTFIWLAYVAKAAKEDSRGQLANAA